MPAPGPGSLAGAASATSKGYGQLVINLAKSVRTGANTKARTTTVLLAPNGSAATGRGASMLSESLLEAGEPDQGIDRAVEGDVVVTAGRIGNAGAAGGGDPEVERVGGGAAVHPNVAPGVAD